MDLDHSRFGFGAVDSDAATLRSPTCGDEVSISVTREGDTVTSLVWRGHGCTISMASAAALAAIAPGNTDSELAALAEEFGELVRRPVPVDSGDGDGDLEFEDAARLGDAIAFAGIARLPLRVGCATLAWEALARALDRP